MKGDSMTVTVARMNDRVVEVVRVADTVSFSTERGWVMVCFDFEQSERKKSQFRWVPASTRFDWVRTFAF
jgi:hypothetical protein